MLSRTEPGVKNSLSVSSDDDAVDIAVRLMSSAQDTHSNPMVYLNHPASSLSGDFRFAAPNDRMQLVKFGRSPQGAEVVKPLW